MKFNVAVDGLIDLDAALVGMAEELGKRNARGAVRRVLRYAAQPIFDAMHDGAPEAVKPALEIGEKLTPRQRRLQREGGFTPASSMLYVGASYRKGSRGRLAHLWEFGTQERVQLSTGRRTGRMRFQPFARPAWDGNKMQALERLKRQLWVEIRKTTERARRKAARQAARAAAGG